MKAFSDHFALRPGRIIAVDGPPKPEITSVPAVSWPPSPGLDPWFEDGVYQGSTPRGVFQVCEIITQELIRQRISELGVWDRRLAGPEPSFWREALRHKIAMAASNQRLDKAAASMVATTWDTGTGHQY